MTNRKGARQLFELAALLAVLAASSASLASADATSTTLSKKMSHLHFNSTLANKKEATSS